MMITLWYYDIIIHNQLKSIIKEFSLTNTYAFDNILQLYIAPYFDKNEIKNFISLNNSYLFFQLIINIATHGIRKIL